MFYLPQDYDRYCLQPGDVVMLDSDLSRSYIIKSNSIMGTTMESSFHTGGKTGFTISKSQYSICFNRWLKKYNIKVGTEVEITHIVNSSCDGSPFEWSGGMNLTLHTKHKIKYYLTNHYGGIVLSNDYYYPYFCLKVIQNNPELHTSNSNLNIESEEEVKINLPPIRSIL